MTIDPGVPRTSSRVSDVTSNVTSNVTSDVTSNVTSNVTRRRGAASAHDIATRHRRVTSGTALAVALGTALLLTATTGFAQGAAPRDTTTPDPRAVQPERPSVATHAGTVATGYLELESGIERDRLDDGTHAVAVPTLLKLGLAPRVQLSVQLPAARATGAPFGFGDVAVGVKWRIVDGDRRLQNVALLPQVKLASGGDRGTGTTDASLLLIDSRTLGPVGLDLNAGATWRSGDGTRAPRHATLWAAAASVPVRGALGWAVELSGLPGTRGPAGSPPTVAFLTGPTFLVRAAFAVDAGIIAPVVGTQARAVYAGLVVNAGRLVPARRVTSARR